MHSLAALCSSSLGALASLCSRRRQRLAGGGAVNPQRRKWEEAGVKEAQIVVRALSGRVLLEKDGATFDTPLVEVAAECCAQLGDVAVDTVRLVVQGQDRHHDPEDGWLGDIAVPTVGEPLEMTLVRLPGPPVAVSAKSGRPIELLKTTALPKNSFCHFDRNYRFISLGGFADRPNVRYLKTSNDDKALPAGKWMWRLKFLMPAHVYLNFRSRQHVDETRAQGWIEAEGWEERPEIASTVSSGVPRGPYQGPVFRKTVEPGTLDLFGAECREGVYFVFVELLEGES